MSFQGKKHTEEWKKKASERVKLLRSKKHWGLSGDANPAKRPEVRKKISEAQKGRLSHRKGKGLEEEYGKTRAREIRQKMSDVRKGNIPWNTGKDFLAFERNPRWKGGRIDSLKRKCLLRDNFTCRNCSLREPEIMEVDHIKEKWEIPELYLNLDNMQTLCPNCHRRKTMRRYKDMQNGNRMKWRQKYA